MHAINSLGEFIAAKDPKDSEDPIVPDYEPSVPGTLQTPTGQVLGWAAGIGLSMAVLGGLVGWACVAIGQNTERAGLAARGKQGILWSVISGMGIGVTSGLVLAFYNMTQ
ncbi:hypothetical protein SBI_04831 [Streptomyces bingchenggensis BCW-1]|uniref:Uncharacterized protein n=2 Tax=Streptomyces TaxID=1883 RepID=D7C150_STRBB|nr:hypothetical protein SBI_04831 [Streptomyces bingchenggensis BCW-1]